MAMRDMIESQNKELEAAGSRQSWHNLYKSSSWIYVGGLDYGLTEGDIEAVFSQYGKIVQLNYVKDRDSGKPKGFSFINFEDQRSTVLSVDNLNGIRLCNRFLKVDHVRDYKPPEHGEDGGGGRGGGGRGGRDKRGESSRHHYSYSSRSDSRGDRPPRDNRDDRPGFGYSRRDVDQSKYSSRRSRSRSSSSDSSSPSRSPKYRDISPATEPEPSYNNRGYKNPGRNH